MSFCPSDYKDINGSRQIAYIGSPLATPWWAEANIAVGFVFFFCELFSP